MIAHLIPRESRWCCVSLSLRWFEEIFFLQKSDILLEDNSGSCQNLPWMKRYIPRVLMSAALRGFPGMAG